MNRIFKDLLALHGYPLPFESTETIAEREAANAAAFGPRYGNRIAAARLFGAGRPAPRAPAADVRGCALGTCG